MYWTPDPLHPVDKVCSRCGIEKHLMDFHLRYETGKRRAMCKECRRAQSRRYYRDHAAQRCADSARYQREHPDARRAWVRRRYQKHRDEMLEATHRWYAKNREQAKETKRRWAQANPEKMRAARRRCRKRYPKRAAIRQATKLLRKAGVLAIDPACAHCGGPATEHHHLHYRNPYAVISLCRRCHMTLHHDRWRKERQAAREEEATADERG